MCCQGPSLDISCYFCPRGRPTSFLPNTQEQADDQELHGAATLHKQWTNLNQFRKHSIRLSCSWHHMSHLLNLPGSRCRRSGWAGHRPQGFDMFFFNVACADFTLAHIELIWARFIEMIFSHTRCVACLCVCGCIRMRIAECKEGYCQLTGLAWPSSNSQFYWNYQELRQQCSSQQSLATAGYVHTQSMMIWYDVLVLVQPSARHTPKGFVPLFCLLQWSSKSAVVRHLTVLRTGARTRNCNRPVGFIAAQISEKPWHDIHDHLAKRTISWVKQGQRSINWSHDSQINVDVPESQACLSFRRLKGQGQDLKDLRYILYYRSLSLSLSLSLLRTHGFEFVTLPVELEVEAHATMLARNCIERGALQDSPSMV